MKRVGFFFLFICVSLKSYSLDCNTLLATNFGAKGSTTVTLDNSGRLIHWKDGYRGTAGRSIPEFQKEIYDTQLGSFGALRSFSVSPEAGSALGIWAATDSRGVGKLYTSESSGYPILFKDALDISAAQLYRIPYREFQKNQYSGSWEELESAVPVHLYVAVENSIFVASIFRHELTKFDLPIQQRILAGPLSFFTAREGNLMDVAPLRNSVLDFSESGNRSFLIRGNSATSVLEITPFRKVLTVPKSSVIDRIDYFQVISPGKIVVATEPGNVLVIDTVHNRVIATPNFPKPVWIRGISAGQFEDRLEVWAIDASDKRIYRWVSGGIADQFTLMPLLPNGVAPESISMVQYELPHHWTAKKNGEEGYFNLYTGGLKEVNLRRYLALGDDGLVYGYTDREPGGVDIQERHWEWITHPYKGDN